MSGRPAVSLALMTCHDFLLYASQDYGATARPARIIGNYALMYALNRHIPGIRRVTSLSTPFYGEDLPMMQTYATPAAHVDDFPYYQSGSARRWLSHQIQVGGSVSGSWRHGDPVMITWNSIGESLLDKMEQDSLNIPKVGAYYRYPPLTTYYFYSVGGDLPRLVRIGKKYIPARISTTELEVEERTGVFQPTCPVTVADLPDDTMIRSGSLLTVPPSPVLIGAELEGRYLECKDPEGLIHRLPAPKTDIYRSVWGGKMVS
ncbi:MAG: type I-D CRISPR-associated protein Cas5/Csc1 [Candidatus Thorarchaeota archaeon]|nr:type I-D CRISPR-associated protein Cas5/Csc1 [Candidatus Thorarchaeota archaeon]